MKEKKKTESYLVIKLTSEIDNLRTMIIRLENKFTDSQVRQTNIEERLTSLERR